MNKIFITTFFILLLVAVTGCDREEDDFVTEPTEKSITITGLVCTQEKVPFANIPVSVDYESHGITGTLIRHKAKGTTDKSGRFKIFFNANESGADLVTSKYTFSVDLSSVSPDSYIRPWKKLDFYISSILYNEGKTLTLDVTIPRKKMIKVTVDNKGIPLKNGDYAIRNLFNYGKDWDNLSPFYNSEEIMTFEPIQLQANGTASVMLPAAVGVTNRITAVYTGLEEEVRYGYGLAVSDTITVDINDSFNSELALDYKESEEFTINTK